MSWKLKEFERSMYKIIEVIDDDGNVVKTFVADQLTYAEKKKKAQLMAAAPELLKAAKLALDFFENCREDICGREENIEYMEKAINKAKGADE